MNYQHFHEVINDSEFKIHGANLYQIRQLIHYWKETRIDFPSERETLVESKMNEIIKWVLTPWGEAGVPTDKGIRSHLETLVTLVKREDS